MLTAAWPDLDRVVELRDDGLVAARRVSISEDVFDHHFPGLPIVPAVMLLSWLEHAAGLFIAHRSGGIWSAVTHRCGLVRCLRTASPGDRLLLTVVFKDPPLPRSPQADAPLAIAGTIENGERKILRASMRLQIVGLDGGARSWSRIARAVGLDDGSRRSEAGEE